MLFAMHSCVAQESLQKNILVILSDLIKYMETKSPRLCAYASRFVSVVLKISATFISLMQSVYKAIYSFSKQAFQSLTRLNHAVCL